MSGTTAIIIFWFLAIINQVAYFTFKHDKNQAQSAGRRVPENTLLILAVFGGWFGAKLAQHRFRHKTRKQPFGLYLNLVPFAWVLVFIFVQIAPGLASLVPTFSDISNGGSVERTPPRFFQSVPKY